MRHRRPIALATATVLAAGTLLSATVSLAAAAGAAPLTSEAAPADPGAGTQLASTLQLSGTPSPRGLLGLSGKLTVPEGQSAPQQVWVRLSVGDGPQEPDEPQPDDDTDDTDDGANDDDVPDGTELGDDEDVASLSFAPSAHTSASAPTHVLSAAINVSDDGTWPANPTAEPIDAVAHLALPPTATLGEWTATVHTSANDARTGTNPIASTKTTLKTNPSNVLVGKKSYNAGNPVTAVGTGWSAGAVTVRLVDADGTVKLTSTGRVPLGLTMFAATLQIPDDFATGTYRLEALSADLTRSWSTALQIDSYKTPKPPVVVPPVVKPPVDPRPPVQPPKDDEPTKPTKPKPTPKPTPAPKPTKPKPVPAPKPTPTKPQPPKAETPPKKKPTPTVADRPDTRQRSVDVVDKAKVLTDADTAAPAPKVKGQDDYQLDALPGASDKDAEAATGELTFGDPDEVVLADAPATAGGSISPAAVVAALSMAAILVGGGVIFYRKFA